MFYVPLAANVCDDYGSSCWSTLKSNYFEALPMPCMYYVPRFYFFHATLLLASCKCVCKISVLLKFESIGSLESQKNYYTENLASSIIIANLIRSVIVKSLTRISSNPLRNCLQFNVYLQTLCPEKILKSILEISFKEFES